MIFDYDKNFLWYFLGDIMYVYVIEIMIKVLYDFYVLFSMYKIKIVGLFEG